MFDYYRDFKLNKLFTPKFRHLLFVAFWPVYLTVFILTERLVVPVYNMYSPLDDYIPFCEFFVIPYVLWYALLAFVSLYTLLFDVPLFKKFYTFLCISSVFTFAIHIIFPNMQNLRPDEFLRDNVFVDIMKALYSVDTNTNVCPSIHVIFSMGMLFTVWNAKHFKGALCRSIALMLTVLICLATVFLKQHSVIDVFVGIGLSAVISPFIFVNFKNKNIF